MGDFNEGDHPRDDKGEFTDGGGATTQRVSTAKVASVMKQLGGSSKVVGRTIDKGGAMRKEGFSVSAHTGQGGGTAVKWVGGTSGPRKVSDDEVYTHLVKHFGADRVSRDKFVPGKFIVR